MTDESKIRYRLLSVPQVHAMHLLKFIRLLNVRFADGQVDSVAITCDYRPELLLNRGFIDRFCQTDEHLFMLVVHEIFRLLLGYAGLISTSDEIGDIACDAAINARLCKLLPGDEFVSFFTSLNSDTGFPSALLRPIGIHTPDRLISVLSILYNSSDTYSESYRLLVDVLGHSSFEKGDYRLLGNHGELSPFGNSILRKMIEDVIVENRYRRWLQELLVRADTESEIAVGTLVFGDAIGRKVSLSCVDEGTRSRMTGLLERAGVVSTEDLSEPSILSDRVTDAVAASTEHDGGLISGGSSACATRVSKAGEADSSKSDATSEETDDTTFVFVHCDQSLAVSMGWIMPLFERPYIENRISLFAFSNKVIPVTYSELRDWAFPKTFTSDCREYAATLDCVFEHLFSPKRPNLLKRSKKPKRILILCSELNAWVSVAHRKALKKSGIEVYVGLFDGTIPLRDIADGIESFRTYEPSQNDGLLNTGSIRYD